MTIGLPQPRVLLVIRALAVCAAIAGCGGGAQMRKIDSGAAGTGDGGSPSTDGPAVTPHDSGVDHPGTPVATLANGDACTSATACQSGFCVDGVCCESACTGACLYCASADSKGKCVPADLGTNPRNQCKDQGPTTCGTDGYCDGTGVCEKYPAGVACQTAGCTGAMLTFAGRCDGAGTCAAPASQSVRAVHLRHGRAVQDDVLDGQRLRHRLLRLRQLRQEADRRQLRDERRLQLGVLRPGRLLRDRLHGHLQVVRGPGERRHLHQRAGRAGPAGPVRHAGPRDLHGRRLLRRQGRLREVRGRAPLAAPAPARARRSRPPASATAPVRAAAGHAADLQPVRVRHRRHVQEQLRRRHRLQQRLLLRRGQLRQEGLGRGLHDRLGLRDRPLRAGGLLQDGLRRHLHVLRAAHLQRDLHGHPGRRWTPTTSAPTRWRRTPAGPAAPATATARARSTRRGRTAAPPRARGRR